METYTLQRTALPELTFNGQLLVESIGEDLDNVTQGRRHDIAIYETDDGELILHVLYHSPFETELSDSFVEALQSVDEVEAALSLYDATERIEGLRAQDRDTVKWQTVAASLVSRFDSQVLKVLGALTALKCA